MVVPAPGRFSTTTLWPSLPDICCATTLPNASGGEPALNGDMMRMGLAGNVSAAAWPPVRFAAASAAAVTSNDERSLDTRNVMVRLLYQMSKRFRPHHRARPFQKEKFSFIIV